MPLYTQQVSRYGSHVGLVRDARDKVNEYRASATNQKQSVYSPHAVIILDKSLGICAGCKIEHELINDYCDTCRSCGANERQCMNPKAILR